jgi:steroid delta-isomerase-like uncharacterized protein
MFGTTTMKAAHVSPAPAEVLAAFAEEVFGKKDFSQLDRFVRADYIQHNPLVAHGSAGFRQFFESWFKASPDFKHEVKQIAVAGDRVWVYGTYSGTHAGDWLGLPATGRAYSFDAVDIFRIEDGKLAEHWDVLDIYSLFRQLGAIA